ncbi:hypothetical protein AAG906_013774 [Vitis piasezkii]
MRYPGGMRDSVRGSCSLETWRVRVGERVPSRMPWGRLAKEGSLAPHTREKLSEIIRGVTVGIRASTRDGWW